MNTGTWRDIAAPIIHKVLAKYKAASEKEIRKALREAYPFGEREYWPYKVWLDEIRRQRGILKRKDRAPEEQGRLF
jgi:hypothetical protein